MSAPVAAVPPLVRRRDGSPHAPGDCGLCGIPQHGHFTQVNADGFHLWDRPTQAQIKARMLARLADRARDSRKVPADSAAGTRPNNP